MILLVICLFLRIFLWNWESPPIWAFQTIIPFISVFMVYSWSAVNPCICFIFSKDYRNGFRQYIFMKNGNGGRMCSATHESVTMPVGRDEITRTAPRTNQIVGSIISGSSSWKVDRPWLLGNILCKLAYFLPDVSLVVSIGSLLLISIDRLIAVVFPLKAKLISSKVRLISILSTWFVAIAVHAPYFYSFKLIPYENETYCKLNWGPAFDHMETHRGFVAATFITFIPIPVCVLAGVYSIIAWKMRKKNKKTREKLSCRQNHRDQQLKKIVRLGMAIIISFVSCMTPLLIYSFLTIFLWNWESPPICAFQTVIPFISVFLLHSWSAVNPCICFIFSENYRNGLRQCFHCNGLGRRIPTVASRILKSLLSRLLKPQTNKTTGLTGIISGSSSWKVDRPLLLGNILCKLVYFLPDVSLVISIGSLLLISIDRLIAVVFPLKAKLISSKVRLISILSTWFVAIAVHAPYFYSFKLILDENETYCKLNWGPAFDHMKTHRRFVTATFITFIPIPICVLAGVYSIIAWTIRKKNQKTREKLSCRQNHRDQQLRKIVRLAMAIMISF
ncbi:unnamed protein product, partial [Pocillopora meandrina]